MILSVKKIICTSACSLDFISTKKLGHFFPCLPVIPAQVEGLLCRIFCDPVIPPPRKVFGKPKVSNKTSLGWIQFR